jgi:transposase-like protein
VHRGLRRAEGLPDSITTTWQFAQVQACILHLLRNTFRYASRRDWDELARDLKPVYTAPNAEMAGARFDEFADKWRSRYPAIVNLWRAAWEEFIVFLDYDVEIRKIICSTNAIESLNARYRRAVRARGHFPTDQAALKCLYLVTRSLDPTGRGRARWTMRWLSRPEARCRHCCRSVSSSRSPNPACVSPRTGLSTVGSVRHGSFAGRGSGLCRPGIGNG